MKKISIVGAGLAFVLVALLGFRFTSNQPTTKRLPRQIPAGEAGGTTPGDRLIVSAQGVIDSQPARSKGYNLLAIAYMQKARETGDFALNAKAEEALARAAQAEPGSYDALKLRAKLLLTYHRFGEALEVGRRAQALNPRDHDVYGAMTDALVELGEYDKAVEAAQAMIDLRPDTASYSRVSYLRLLHGDVDGSIAAMRLAAQAASPSDPEKIAWCYVQLGDALMKAGKPAEAEREIDRALFSFPDYHAALAAKGRARQSAGDLGGAVEFYRRAVARVPLPDYSIALGDLYTKLGRTDEAKRQYDLVQFVESAGASAGTYTRELALFWADHDVRLDEALAVAARERAARGDIYTSDVLAWCLFKKGRLEEAKAAVTEALRLGTRDSRLFYHAGMIYNSLGDRRQGAKYLKMALAADPSFPVLQADAARHTLSALKV
ncbi:MAG: tetratricopeptide repeat protein [Pyrinomonadaceae bacterium]